MKGKRGTRAFLRDFINRKLRKQITIFINVLFMFKSLKIVYLVNNI